MKKDLSKTYREINIMLDLLGKPFKQRLPKSMIPFFKEHEDKNHNPRITLTREGFSRNLQYVLMTMMYINYWCEDPEEKERLKKAWMNPGNNGDYDVFSKDAYKNAIGINIATAKYKDSPDVPQNSNSEVTVDMNKYGNLFDNGGSSSSNNLVVNNDTTKKYSKVKTIIGKFSSSLKGLLATFSKK